MLFPTPDGPQITLDRVMDGLMTLVADEPLPEDPEALASLCAFEQSLRVPEQAANTLEITIKWMNSWFENVIRFEKTDSGLAITTVKDRLQAGPMRYSIHHAAAVKQTV